jgi:hypothetical protein
LLEVGYRDARERQVVRVRQKRKITWEKVPECGGAWISDEISYEGFERGRICSTSIQHPQPAKKAARRPHLLQLYPKTVVICGRESVADIDKAYIQRAVLGAR